MSIVQWTDIRETTGKLLFAEHRLLVAIEGETRATNRLEERLAKIEKENDGVEEKLLLYQNKLTKATKAEKMDKYRDKLSKWGAESARLEEAAARAREEFEAAKAFRVEWGTRRSHLIEKIEKMLENFSTEKWVTLLGMEDATAISMFHDLDKEAKTLNFMLGSSIRQPRLENIDWALEKIGLTRDLRGEKTVYELTQAGLRCLSEEEKSRLEGGSPAPAATESGRSGGGSGEKSSDKKRAGD